MPSALRAAASGGGKLREGEARGAAWAAAAVALAARIVPSKQAPRFTRADVGILCMGRIGPKLSSTTFFFQLK